MLDGLKAHAGMQDNWLGTRPKGAKLSCGKVQHRTHLGIDRGCGLAVRGQQHETARSSVPLNQIFLKHLTPLSETGTRIVSDSSLLSDHV